MKASLLILLTGTLAYSQLSPIIFKNNPSSMIFFSETEGSDTVHFTYDAFNRLLSVQTKMECENFTASYDKRGDTTIIQIASEACPGVEADTHIVKQIYDSEGKILSEIACDKNENPEEESVFFYNSAGDIIREECTSYEPGVFYGDSTVYQWDYSNKLITETLYGNGEIWSLHEHEFDDKKRITGTVVYECNDDECVEIGNVFYRYPDTRVRDRSMQKDISTINSYSTPKYYAINGRAISGTLKHASSVVIARKRGKSFSKLMLK